MHADRNLAASSSGVERAAFGRGLDRDRLDYWCERGILGLVLLILIYGPLATPTERMFEVLFLQILTLGVLFLWLVRIWISPHHVFLWPPVCWAVLAFLAYAVGSYALTDLEYISRQEMVKVLFYGFLFFAVVNNLNRQESVQIIALVLILLAAVIALYASYQFFSHSRKVWHWIKPEQYGYRGSGSYICPDHCAGFLEMILPLGIFYALIGRFSHAFKVVLFYLSGLILLGIALTITRAAWVATGLSLLVGLIVLIRQRNFRWRALVVLTVLLMAAMVFAQRNQETAKRFGLLHTTGGKIFDSRFAFWTAGVKVWQENPWLGAGPDHFEYRFRPYRIVAEGSHYDPQFVHNEYLQVLCDYGVAGFVIITAAWLLFYLGAIRTWPFIRRNSNDLSPKTSNKSAFVLAGGVGLFAILIHSVVDFQFHVAANAFVAVTLMALVTGYTRFATERYWLGASLWLKILFSVVIAGGLVYLALQTERRARQYVALESASKRKSLVDYIANLEKAHRAEPENFETIYQLGETLRLKSWEGDPGFEALARRAMDWFTLAMKLNPYDPYPPARFGMCLDWLGRTSESQSYFDRALKLDPNNHYIVALQGWHAIQLGDYANAKVWLEKSLRIRDNFKNLNSMAASYLEIVNRRLAEQAKPAK